MLTMKEVCQETGMSYENLKFYCNEGLVPNVKRNENNHRVFDQQDVAWLKGLARLKSCGMSIQEMKHYTALCAQGKCSVPARKEILRKKREELLLRIHALEEGIAYIDETQAFFDSVLEGRIAYRNHLLPHAGK